MPPKEKGTGKGKKNIEKEVETMGAFTADDLTDLTNTNTKTKGNIMPDDFFGGNNVSGNIFTPDFSDTHDEVILPNDTEAKVCIKRAEVKLDKNRNPYWAIGMSIVEAPAYADQLAYVSDFTQNMFMLANAKDDAKQRNRKNLRLQAFMQAFGLDLNSPFTLESLCGLEAWCILKVEESEEYGDKNQVKRWLKAA